MADLPQIKFLGGHGALAPGQKDPREDLPGYKPKPPLFPPGTPASPYVRDRAGMIWFFEPWMSDMGDSLQPCWEAPPKPQVRVAFSPMDIEHYGKQAPQPTEAPPQPAQQPAAQMPSFSAVGSQGL